MTEAGQQRPGVSSALKSILHKQVRIFYTLIIPGAEISLSNLARCDGPALTRRAALATALCSSPMP